MADDDLEFWMTVKNTIRYHSKYVKTDTLCKGQWRSNEPLTICPELLIYAARRVSGMEIDRDVQLRAGLPEWIPPGIIVEYMVFAVLSCSLCVIDKSAFEVVFLNASAEFVCCLLRVMHRESSASTSTTRPSRHAKVAYAKAANRSGEDFIFSKI